MVPGFCGKAAATTSPGRPAPCTHTTRPTWPTSCGTATWIPLATRCRRSLSSYRPRSSMARCTYPAVPTWSRSTACSRCRLSPHAWGFPMSDAPGKVAAIFGSWSPSVHHIRRLYESVRTDLGRLLTFLYSVVLRTGPHGTASITRLHASILERRCPRYGFAGWYLMAQSLRLVSVTMFFSLLSHAQVNILTANGSNDRNNSNLQETQLSPATVTSSAFGKLGVFPVDGQVYSQPLIVSGLSIPGGGTHNVVYVSTMHNSVYAFDADAMSPVSTLWQVNLGASVPTVLLYGPDGDIANEAGILSTGVIDLQRGVLYVVADTLEVGAPVFYLHALDLATGAERLKGPVALTATVPGTGTEARPDGTIPFDPMQHIQRPGLLLASNSVFIAFGSHGDQSPYHGWMLSYDASDLSRQLSVYMTTPDGDAGSIWQAGRGPAVDRQGNIYLITAHGDYDGIRNASVYTQGEGEPVKCFQVTGNSVEPDPVSTGVTAVPFGRVGMTISANGNQDGSGILWETTGDYSGGTPGTLHAYDASNLANEVWNSDINPARDRMPQVAKFAPPTVANGKVYVPSFDNVIAVYGLFAPPDGVGATPSINAVTQAASYSQDAVAPGELVAIFGSSLGPAAPVGTQLDGSGNVATSLADTQVLFDGVASPMIFASAGQVDAVVPFGVATGRVLAQVEYQGLASALFPVTVAPAVIGIFSADASGAGQAIALNQDGGINSPDNPAAPGSVVTLWATGAGLLSPAGIDGAVDAGNRPQPVLPVLAQMGGQVADVLYAGGAPGMVEGVIQVNLRVPPASQTGAAVPVVLRVGDSVSQIGITLAIRSP